ncbi:uncharacterized protein LOC100680109 [Nasonia vitripennis]|uniref:Uncharacterized protein n=1 Tax=Nasonia vitripennis TaxID=7425 RepID=A0A7M7HF63_NASVI|nr:uncharacterized protein LOC100680109 [Nasonia vitripennis]
MILKTAIFLACSTAALGFTIDSRIKRQDDDSTGPLSNSRRGLGDTIISSAIDAGGSLASTGLEVAGDVASKGIDSLIHAGSDTVQHGIDSAINGGTDLAKDLASKGVADNFGKGINNAILAGSDAVQGGIAKAINAGIDLAAMGVETVGAIGSRVQTAFNETYQDEKNSVGTSFTSVKDLIHQNIETEANVAKTIFDLGTIIPKFGKNLILG